MEYKLVICEKPSVAQSIARVIGARNRCDGYLEGGNYIVSWCVGHLIELAEPETYDEKYSTWRKDDLPILPEKMEDSTWKYQVSASTKKQFQVLKELMKRKDVASLVNACDAGREGELIFRLVYHQVGCKKPFERLWISSMEDSAIREGFSNLRPGADYDSLYAAALCRERADWIVGINATRLFSCLYRQPLNVGRVVTPTLAMTVSREAEIAAFKPEIFYTVEIAGDGFTASGKRLRSKEEAEELCRAIEEEQVIEVRKVTEREREEKPPKLYDLTTLQRDANTLLGYTAQQTLEYTQSLYEKKLCTYPRTDSRYLTKDMKAALPKLTGVVEQVYEIAEETDAAATDDIEETEEIYFDYVIDDDEVSDHHAIIPTGTISRVELQSLPEGEQQILKLIAERLLAATAGPYRYAEKTAELQAGGMAFPLKGKTCLEEGWRGIRSQFRGSDPKGEGKDKQLPDIKEGDQLPLKSCAVKEGQTTPPAHFNEASLLSSMERADAAWRGEAAETEDGEPEDMEASGKASPAETAAKEKSPYEPERKGIGTPATRAGIIEKLVAKGFIERCGNKKARNLIPTKKGNALITVMPEQIQSPSMTADWEDKLSMIEHGEYDADQFMQEIEQLVQNLVDTYEAAEGSEFLMPKGTVIGKCPHCGSEVIERPKGWFCSNRDCRFALWKENAFFEKLGKRLDAKTAEKLLHDKWVMLRNCRSAKTGKNYDVMLHLSTEKDGRASFRLSFEK